MFSEYENGKQPGTAWYATGAQARQPEPGGEVLAEGIPVGLNSTAQPVTVNGIRLFTGLRSDPFFADVEGALHGFVWTGHDDFADNNVDSIRAGGTRRHARQPGDRRLGLDQPLPRRRHPGATGPRREPDHQPVHQPRRPEEPVQLFAKPANDATNYLDPWSEILRATAATNPTQAKAAALQVLPDILHYDRTQPATYPNGRVLTDDVYSLRFAWLTNGKVPSPASSPTTTCWPTTPTSARRTPSRQMARGSPGRAPRSARRAWQRAGWCVGLFPFRPEALLSQGLVELARDLMSSLANTLPRSTPRCGRR